MLGDLITEVEQVKETLVTGVQEVLYDLPYFGEGNPAPDALLVLEDRIEEVKGKVDEAIEQLNELLSGV